MLKVSDEKRGPEALEHVHVGVVPDGLQLEVRDLHLIKIRDN